jgi:hypothetical protein
MTLRKSRLMTQLEQDYNTIEMGVHSEKRKVIKRKRIKRRTKLVALQAWLSLFHHLTQSHHTLLDLLLTLVPPL